MTSIYPWPTQHGQMKHLNLLLRCAFESEPEPKPFQVRVDLYRTTSPETSPEPNFTTFEFRLTGSTELMILGPPIYAPGNFLVTVTCAQYPFLNQQAQFHISQKEIDTLSEQFAA